MQYPSIKEKGYFIPDAHKGFAHYFNMIDLLSAIIMYTGFVVRMFPNANSRLQKHLMFVVILEKLVYCLCKFLHFCDWKTKADITL